MNPLAPITQRLLLSPISNLKNNETGIFMEKVSVLTHRHIFCHCIFQDFSKILCFLVSRMKFNAAAQTQHGVNKNWDSFQFSNDYADPLLMVEKK